MMTASVARGTMPASEKTFSGLVRTSSTVSSLRRPANVLGPTVTVCDATPKNPGEPVLHAASNRTRNAKPVRRVFILPTLLLQKSLCRFMINETFTPDRRLR
jgi:hypothetical protein